MKEPEDEIPNLDFPIATIIRESLMALPPDQKEEVLESMTADEFIIHRVDIYLIALENAMHQGWDEMGAKEIALKECMAGIAEGDD